MNPKISGAENDQVEQHSDLIKKIIQTTIDSVDPYRLVFGSIVLSNANLCIGKKTYSSIKNVILIAFGKASIPMTKAVMDRMGEKVTRGVCVTKSLPADLPSWPQIEIIQGGHPIPNESSVEAGKQVREALQGLKTEDLVLVLISGGASALVASPFEPITLEDLQLTNQALIRCGQISTKSTRSGSILNS
jgi:glycerate-2-kinase